MRVQGGFRGSREKDVMPFDWESATEDPTRAFEPDSGD